MESPRHIPAARFDGSVDAAPRATKLALVAEPSRLTLDGMRDRPAPGSPAARPGVPSQGESVNVIDELRFAPLPPGVWLSRYRHCACTTSPG